MTTEVVHPADLDPSRVGERTYLSRRRLPTLDAATLLAITVVLLAIVPPRFLIPGAPDFGRPGLLLGMLLFGWWLLVRLSPGLMLRGPQPLRIAVLAYVVSMLVSYAVAQMRSLTSLEANAADATMIGTLAYIGVMLVAADGVTSWSRLRLVVGTLVGAVAVMAVVGIVQIVTRYDITQHLVFPGLWAKHESGGFEERGAGLRVASLAGHYIEFSTVLATTLPFAIHFARFGSTKRVRVLSTVAAVLIGAAIPATISRTGLLAVTIALVVTAAAWSWRLRYNMAMLAVTLVVGMIAVMPKMADTLTTMFTGAGEDASITSRTERYGMIYSYFVETPWLGRGTGTWASPQYQYLDNQWFSQALTNGLLGVATLLAMHVTAIWLGLAAMRRAATAADRHLCVAVVSTQFVAIFAAFTFDSHNFSTYGSLMFLSLGLCAAVWRFTHPDRGVRTAATVTPRRLG